MKNGFMQPYSVSTKQNSDTDTILTLDFFLCFISFSFLLLDSRLGMWAIVGFIVPWGLVFLRKNHIVLQGLIKNWVLLLFPLLAIISMLWSHDAHWSVKAGIELAATVVIGITAGVCIIPRTLISALFCALLTVAIISILTMWNTLLNDTGNAYLNGIFGSKNAFAAMMSLLLLTAIAVSMDKNQPWLFRRVGFVTMIVTPCLLFLSHSLDAVLGVVLTMAIFFLVKFLKRLSKNIRPVAYMVILLSVAVVATILLFSENIMTEVLQFFGKDTTLTGRTFLWQTALENINERPFLGIGYGAFWRTDNPQAQALWYALQVPAGPGFNFHNEYLELLVELGFVGCGLCVAYLLILSRRAFQVMFQSPLPEQIFAFLIILFHLVRTPVEVAIFSQFDLSMVLFCIFWVYLKPQKAVPNLGKAS